jgi:hypothetical protein
LSGAPAPTKLASLDDLLALYPGLVDQVDLGYDREGGEFRFLTLRDGVFQPEIAPAHPDLRIRLFTFLQSTSVGRHSTLLGPENTLVADLGYFLPHTDPQSVKWTDCLSPKYWRSRWLVDVRFRQQLPAIQHLPGTAALLNNPWCHNFYHWLMEVAPRVMILRQAGLDADWYVVECQSGYQKRALELLGIPAERCIQPHYGLHLRADRFLRPSFPGIEQCRLMAKTIGQNLPTSSIAGGERIYVTRKTAAHRKLANERDLENLLREHGFQSYSFDGLDFAQQVSLLRSAKYLVTVHGAALANLVFAKPGLRVIEICPVNRYNTDCFPRLSHKLGHHHVSIMAPSTRYRQNLSVNIDDVRLALEYHGLRQTQLHLKAA